MQNLENTEASVLATLPSSPTSDESNPEAENELYRVWACDNLVYGPIPRSVLIEWAVEGRVLRDTWVYLHKEKTWRMAAQLTVLQNYLPPGEETLFLERKALEPDGINPADLRQFPMFSGLSNAELAHFVKVAEVITARPGELIVRRREPGDAIYFLLSGQVRVRITVGGDEKVLNTVGPGEFFGEMAMLTHTPRSADVVAMEECRLLRFSAQAFQESIQKGPAFAAPMMYSIASTLAHRIASGNTRFQQEVASGFVWR